MTSADPNCTVCGGSGQIVHDTWRAIPQAVETCACVRTNHAAAAAAARLAHTGLPGVYAEAEIDLLGERDGRMVEIFDADRKSSITRDQGDIDRENKDKVRALASQPLDPGSSIILTGPPGAGKTYLAAALLREQVRKFGLTGFYVTAYTYKETLLPDGGTSEEQRALKTRVRTTGVLLFDDLGVEKSSPDTMRKLWDVIDTRTKNGLPTIVTSNLSMAAMLGQTKEQRARRHLLPPVERESQEIGERIFSRFKEDRFVIDWPEAMGDYRDNLNRAKDSPARRAFADSRDERIRRHKEELDDFGAVSK